MKLLRHTLNALLVASMVAAGNSAWAQFRGGDGGGDRGDRGSRGGDSYRGRGSFDPSEFYKRMDRNGNGVIEPDELSERSRGFLADTARRSGDGDDFSLEAHACPSRIFMAFAIRPTLASRKWPQL